LQEDSDRSQATKQLVLTAKNSQNDLLLTTLFSQHWLQLILNQRNNFESKRRFISEAVFLYLNKGDMIKLHSCNFITAHFLPLAKTDRYLASMQGR